MAELLFGLELELGFSGSEGGNRRPMRGPPMLQRFMEFCQQRLTFLRSGEWRLFLENGGLLYPDCGHPEYATPECQTPRSLLQALRAGERLLAGIAEELAREEGVADVCLFRTNVDYLQPGTTWGCHESYLTRRPPQAYAHTVVPHLVSRLIYTGGGGFRNDGRGLDFALSPRAFHLHNVIGSSTTSDRAIFSLRREPLAGPGFHRVHLICGEPNCSELSSYLKIGTTALVVAMAEAGVAFGKGIELDSPVDAIHRLSLDTSCTKRVRLRDGQMSTALDIQRRYLEQAEAQCEADFMPEWAEDVCVKWRFALDELERDPDRLATRLDWPIKLALFKHHARRHSSVRWDTLPIWSTVTKRVYKGFAAAGQRLPNGRIDGRIIRAALAGKSALQQLLRNLTDALDEHGLEWDEIEAFEQLRHELYELDIRFGQLWPAGVFLELEGQGALDHGILGRGESEPALNRAPGAGRARVRGDCIRALANEEPPVYVDWDRIVYADRTLDLSDPFTQHERWESSVAVEDALGDHLLV